MRDFAAMLLHYVLWLVVPPLFFGVALGNVILFYVAWTALVGLILSAIFAPVLHGPPASIGIGTIGPSGVAATFVVTAP